ncbi:MAG TPA: APC family permease [Candidatus Acidoferrum sp.]|nr:APC family permease [Candidatus Acidoferrum sp.]
MSSLSLPAHYPSHTIPTAKKSIAKLSLWPLVAATFFMVSGGTYGTEEIIHGAGYGRGILILLFLPVLWSLPPAFMVGELSSALPAEGGYYAWVRRGMGNFWGFQEAWLSLAASIFDMAIYPTLFVAYLTQVAPWFAGGQGWQILPGVVITRAMMVGAFVILGSTVINLAGIRVVGITSLWLFFLLSAPFALVVLLAPFSSGTVAATHSTAASAGELGVLGGVLVAMWNYMGWDNASTIAREVERPQRTYPRAMIAAVVLVALSYILPFVAVYAAGVPTSAFEGDGSWARVAGMIAGTWHGFNWLGFLLVLGGMMSAFGMFNALVMSYSRLPLAMAQDGMMPKLFAKTSAKSKTPWVAIVACCICWTLCLGLGFRRLVTLDIMLYGASLMLEFVTLVVLRIKEPGLKREFRVPGGLTGAVLLGVFPLLLLLLAMIESNHETVLGINGLLFGTIIMFVGFIIYFVSKKMKILKVKPVVTEEIGSGEPA